MEEYFICTRNIDNTVKIAEMCNIKFDFNTIHL